jgi:hypothetical protein
MQALQAPVLLPTDVIGLNIAPKVSISAIIDLIDSAPQAIGYWVDKYEQVHYTQETPKRIYKLSILDENTDLEHLISVNTIIEGIQKIVAGNVEINSSIISYILSDIGQGLAGGYIDGEALDVIIQVGLFGEIVYG